jgi:putative FmdB family regulatory protein
MPTYEYACTVCGERTEARQKFTDSPLTECPICGGGLRKLYSPVGIVFKGTGFYATESRQGGQGDSGSSSKESDRGSKDGQGSQGSDKSSGEAKKSGDSTKQAAQTATKSSEKK